jgi:hypothetical protein
MLGLEDGYTDGYRDGLQMDGAMVLMLGSKRGISRSTVKCFGLDQRFRVEGRIMQVSLGSL